MDKETIMMRRINEIKPDWEMNKIAPLRACKDQIICCGLSDANSRDGLLWFSDEEDIKYICEALNFYETYSPIFESLKIQCKELLNELERED